MRSSLPVVLSASVLSLALAACGGNRNEKIDYKTPGADTSVKKDVLIVPPDLVTPKRDERFVVPGAPAVSTASQAAAATAKPQAAAGAPVAAEASSAKVRLERFGNTRWLVMQGSADQVWPKLRDFWKELGFILVKDDQQLLIMETDWAENRAKVFSDPVRSALGHVLGSMMSNGERDRFRTRIEQGSQPGSIEIFISHRGLEEKMYNQNMGNQPGTYFELQPSNPELEAEMLTRLLVRLGNGNEQTAQAALAETTKAVPERATLGKAADGSQQLIVKDGLDRSWRQVGLALDRIGVVVEDRDRAKGLYFVRYVSADDLNVQKKEGGWFSGWFGSGKKEPGTDQYRVAVSADGDQAKVQLLDKDGKPVSTEASRQILGLLHKELK